MAMGPERSKPLHNFSFPCLKWGNQRYLRCVKVSPNSAEPTSLDRRSSRLQAKSDHFQLNPRAIKTSPQYPFQNPKRRFDAGKEFGDNNIDEVREKLMIDLRGEAKKLKVSILEEEENAANGKKPWNLRTRRAACKAPPQGDERKIGLLNSAPPETVEKKNEKVSFSVSLLKEEVEEDFAQIARTRPPRRPKKRPRNVQRQLDSLFPGLWLTEITPELYEVPEVPE